MSDFQDFLKYSSAYVAVGEFKPGKFEEASQLYAQAVSTYSTGFKGAYLLREPGTDRGISVIFWDSAEDMAANENEELQTILHKMSPLFVKAPTTGVYDVISEITPEDLL